MVMMKLKKSPTILIRSNKSIIHLLSIEMIVKIKKLKYKETISKEFINGSKYKAKREIKEI